MHGSCEKCIQMLVEKPALGKPTHEWEYSIKICLQGVGRNGLDCIYLAQDRGFWWAVFRLVMNC